MSQPFVTSTSLPSFRLWEKLEARRAPLSFELEVTARCNNDCRHCYINRPAGDREARARELSLPEIEAIAGEAASLGAVWCLITGGEALLREDFFEIYLALKRLGLLVSVFTNACLVTREHLALFTKYPPRDLEVTVYGVTPETYERVTRRPGSFAAFRRGLDLLLQGRGEGAPEGHGPHAPTCMNCQRSPDSAGSAPRTTSVSIPFCTCASTGTP